MIAIVIVYLIGFFVTLMIGLTAALAHLDWEGSPLEEYERTMFLGGWRLVKYSWVCRVRRAADALDQGE